MTVTAPFTERAATAVRESVEHVWRVEAWPAGASTAVPLRVEDGTLAFDEAWNPHARASLTCTAPTDQATLDALDPRTNCRIRVSVGYRYQNGVEDVHHAADLALFSRVVNRPSNQVHLEAVSDELRLQEATWFGGSQPPRTGAAEAITFLIEHSDHSGTSQVERQGVPQLYMPEVLTDLAMQLGDSYQSAVDTVADAAGLWVYCPGVDAKTWAIRPRPTVAGRSVAQLTVGPAGTVTGSEAALTREDWFNAVVVVHRWRDVNDVEHVRGGSALTLSGPMSVAEVGRRTLHVNRTTPASQAAVTASARSILRRTISRGRTYNVEALSAYWVRPGHTVTAALPTGPQARHLVAAAAFRFPSGDMSVRTRVPENITIGTGE